MRAVRPGSVLALSIGLLLCLGASASATGVGGWDHLGTGATPSLPALNGRVDALLTAAPDRLYAGGVFTSAGGDPAAAMIARWDGTAWHSIGAPVISTAAGASVAAIAYDSATGKLYVGGNFINAGGNPNADFLAVWDGVSWQPFCAPITANVKALQIVGRELYIGGDFADGAGLLSADKLVGCNMDTGTPSSTVIDVAHEINSAVYALTADSAGRLYAAGSFINMNSIANANYVAMYDGTWHAMQAGAVTGITRSITSDGTNVYIGSDGVDIAGIAQADHVARWDGSAWYALGANTANTDGWFPASTFINGIAAIDSSHVYVTGSFQNADGNTKADQVAQFNGANWAPMGSDGATNGPLPAPGNAIAVFGSRAIVGGNFTTAGDDPLAGYIAGYRVFNVPPTAPITIAAGFHGANTALAYSLAADPDGTIASYRWNWGDGSPDTFDLFASHRYAAPGTYTITLTVTDNDGAQTSSTASVTVRTGPIVSFTFSPTTPMVGQNVTFQSHSIDPDGTIVNNRWVYTALAPGPDLPFLNDSASPTEIHAFSKPGDYDVRLTVTECPTCGVSVFSNQTITVVPAPIPTISKAAVSNAKFRVGSAGTAVTAKAPVGTSFRFTLKAPATITIAIARSAPGVKRGKSCVAVPATLDKGARKCTRAIKAGTLTRKHLQPGANAVAFTGRIGRKALTPGPYTATLTARNAKGKAKPITVKFTIVK